LNACAKEHFIDNPHQNPFADKTPPPAAGAPQAAGGLSKDVCTMAMLAHLLGALLGFIGPLIIWLIKKDEHPFIDDQGKEALNFQLTVLIWYVGAAVISTVSCGVLFFVMFVPMLIQIIFGIIGTVQANNGVYYRYPMSIRFIK
jgi:uncharacterized Tic20 family protein